MFAWDSNPWVRAITFRIAEGPLPEGRRERPILFRGELVRAILEGRKSQTRRPVKLPGDVDQIAIDPGGTIFGPGPYVKAYKRSPIPEEPIMYPRILCPYGYPGDRLWVKETHAFVPLGGRNNMLCAYRATCDGDAFDFCDPEDGSISRMQICRWRPSIYMPRWASRLSLEVVSVRVERLHAITEEDARAEGVEPVETTRKVYPSSLAADVVERSYREGFARKWREIHDGRARRAAEARAV